MASNAGIEPIADPRQHVDPENVDDVYQRTWGLKARVDPSVTFEEYFYWAKIEREMETEAERIYQAEQGPWSLQKMITGRFSKGVHIERKEKAARELAAHGIVPHESESGFDEKNEKAPGSPTTVAVTDEEWRIAARALRTSSWGTIFFLITTDILGWASTPFVFASVGYGPGVALYLIFGAAAFWSGWILYKVFLTLDSSRFPLQSFGDTFYRVYGAKSRHFINVMQALQQFMTVAVLILGCGTILAQLSQNKVCFIACLIIFTMAGIIVGSIRSLQRVGWFANASVWMNIVSFIIIMVAASKGISGIDFQAVYSSTRIKGENPVVTFSGPPPNIYQQQADGFAGQFGGVNQMIYSWGGALLFVAFLAEMRHPMDFWKGMLCAQVFICVVYVFFGAFVYSHFGQYSISNIGNVILPVSLQTVGNVFGLITGLIAAFLYMNIGMKTVYIEVFQEVFNFPEIATKKGRYMWWALGPIYWLLAFVVGAAVPNLNGISGIVSSLLILNFTYTFPAILYVGFQTQLGAMLPGEGFDPHTGITTRHDSGMKRWTRGFLKNFHLTIPNFLYFLGGCACCGMGSWAAVEGLITIFAPGGTVATSFGCAQPV
jgi:amino acid permease